MYCTTVSLLKLLKADWATPSLNHVVFRVSVPSSVSLSISHGDACPESDSITCAFGSSSESISTSFDDVGDTARISNRFEESIKGSSESCSVSSKFDSENDGNSLSASS